MNRSPLVALVANHPLFRVGLFTAAYMLLSVWGAIRVGNREFVFYIAVMAILYRKRRAFLPLEVHFPDLRSQSHRLDDWIHQQASAAMRRSQRWQQAEARNLLG